MWIIIALLFILALSVYATLRWPATPAAPRGKHRAAGLPCMTRSGTTPRRRVEKRPDFTLAA